jgi:hypothetical protein
MEGLFINAGDVVANCTSAAFEFYADTALSAKDHQIGGNARN